MGKGNIPNSEDFMVSYKIQTVFHLSGCFKFKCIFHNVSSFKWVLVLMLFEVVSWNIKTEKNLQSLSATEHANLGLVINRVKFNYVLTRKSDEVTFHTNVYNLILLFSL